jgi:hypothetical protein
MNGVVVQAQNELSSMSNEKIDRVRALEKEAMLYPQAVLQTSHEFHAGVYARTVFLPAGMMITGALIKIPTLVTTSGDLLCYTDNGVVELEGYRVLKAAAHRKQIFVAKKDSFITMIFATTATTIEDAEREFTDEYDLLLTSRERA